MNMMYSYTVLINSCLNYIHCIQISYVNNTASDHNATWKIQILMLDTNTILIICVNDVLNVIKLSPFFSICEFYIFS